MSTIKINPKNKGKFNALKKRTGKTTEQLTHSQNSLTRKRAIFAQNAKKWKHEDGGLVEYGLGGTLSGAGGALGIIPTPWTQIAGAGLGIIGGLVGSVEEKKAAQEQQRMQMAQVSGNMQAGITNNYTPTFATGGIIPNNQPNIEVEGGEQMQGPDGSMAGVSDNAPSHAQGGVDVAAQPGTRIFSDKLKASTGRTFAEEADKIRKQLAKYEKLLS